MIKIIYFFARNASDLKHFVQKKKIMLWKGVKRPFLKHKGSLLSFSYLCAGLSEYVSTEVIVNKYHVKIHSKSTTEGE